MILQLCLMHTMRFDLPLCQALCKQWERVPLPGSLKNMDSQTKILISNKHFRLNLLRASSIWMRDRSTFFLWSWACSSLMTVWDIILFRLIVCHAFIPRINLSSVLFLEPDFLKHKQFHNFFFFTLLLFFPEQLFFLWKFFPHVVDAPWAVKKSGICFFLFYNTQHLITLAWQKSVPVVFLYKWGSIQGSEIYSCTLLPCRQQRIFPSFLACDILKQTLLFVVTAQVAERSISPGI